MKDMEYKGYTASVEFDPEDMTFYGRVRGLVDRISFSGDSVRELVDGFHGAIDNYIECCRETGGEPEIPLSGRLLLRLGPELHTQLARAAKRGKVSNNAWVVAAVREKLAREEGVAGRAERLPVVVPAGKAVPYVLEFWSHKLGVGRAPGKGNATWASGAASSTLLRAQ